MFTNLLNLNFNGNWEKKYLIYLEKYVEYEKKIENNLFFFLIPKYDAFISRI